MPDQSPSRSQPLDRLLSLLETVANCDRPVSITELSSAVGLPAPTVHRLVSQLLARGLLKRAVNSKRVLAGPRLVQFAAGILQSALLSDRSHLILTGLAGEISEHCQIGIVVSGEVLYVDTARIDQALSLQFEPGRRAPLHCTSIGKLYLAALPERQFQSWLAATPLSSFTARTIVEPAALERSVAAVREQNWASNEEEYVPGVVGCAVPVRINGRFVAGLGAAAPSVRFDRARMEAVVPLLRASAEALAKALAGDDAGATTPEAGTGTVPAAHGRPGVRRRLAPR